MAKKFTDNFIWELKYRPDKIENIILPKKIKNHFLTLVKNKKLPNLLLSGSPGTGKTTSAFALCGELDLDYIYINMSKNKSINDVRGQVTDFATTASFDGTKKVIIGDECLEENEEVIVGTVDNYKYVKLKDLPKDEKFNVVSFNMDKKILENDTAEIISEKLDEVFEIELEDGRTINVTKDHPFLVEDCNGVIQEKTLADGLDVGEKIISI